MSIRRLIALLLMSGLALGVAGIAYAQGRPVQQGAPASADDLSAPVEIDGTTLFQVRGTSSLPAERRADQIRARIEAVAADLSVSVDSLHASVSDSATRIFAGDHPLLAVTDADAALEQVSQAELATADLIGIREAILEYRAARTPGALRRATVNTVVATFVFAVVLGSLIWFWRTIDALLERRLQARIHSVGIQSFELMRADRIWAGVRNLIHLLRMLVYVICLLLYAGFVLALWPSTRGFARNIVAFAAAPLQVMIGGVVENIPRLVFLAVLFVVIRLALRMIRLFFHEVGLGAVTLRGFDADWAEPTYKILRVAVIAFALIVAYPYIPGSQSEAFKGVSLFIGIVFSLGSSSAISNIIAGYMMTYRRAFRVGDRVKIGDFVGDVIEMRLQVTHLRSFKNEEIVIPNSQILSGEVLNYSSLARQQPLLLHTEVGIGYETPWRQVEAMLLDAASRIPGIETEPRPFVLIKRLGDFAVVYELNAACRDVPAMNRLYTLLHQCILDVFNEHGVQIMTPAYEGDPEVPKVVPPDKWYAAPSSAPRNANVTT
jgi:small-conductance mechanosensitive channel